VGGGDDDAVGITLEQPAERALIAVEPVDFIEDHDGRFAFGPNIFQNGID
jgi:hypothetical protein